VSRIPLRDSGASWLVPLADLSMILFIITGVTMSARPPEDEAVPPPALGGIAQGVPSGVFVDAPGAPPLAEWLALYRPGSGEQLTVEARFAPADRVWVAARAEELAQAAIAAGFAPRVILQPAPQSQVRALFAYDGADGEEPEQVAQSLLLPEQS
jgi:hypothetical protein